MASLNDSEATAETLEALSALTAQDTTVADLAPAMSASLVDTDGTAVRFMHPLVRSAVPDEHVASQLQEASERARRRGAVVESLAALTRAAELTSAPEARAERLLRAAEVAFELGRPSIGLATQMRDAGEADRALDSLLTAAWTCYWSSPDWTVREPVVSIAETLGVAGDDPTLLATLAFAAPLERGAVVIERLSALPAEAEPDPESLRLLSTAAIRGWLLRGRRPLISPRDSAAAISTSQRSSSSLSGTNQVDSITPRTGSRRPATRRAGPADLDDTRSVPPRRPSLMAVRNGSVRSGTYPSAAAPTSDQKRGLQRSTR